MGVKWNRTPIHPERGTYAPEPKRMNETIALAGGLTPGQYTWIYIIGLIFMIFRSKGRR